MTGSTPEAIVRAARRDRALAVLEGFHAVKHAIRFGADIDGLFTPDPAGLARMAEQLAPDISDRLVGATEVGPEEFDRMAPHPVPTPALAIARRPHVDLDATPALPGRVVLLEDPRHLGNIGAVVRVAAAAGIAAVVTTGDRDPWDPAALRGSAGLHFALPVVSADALPEFSRPLVALHPDGEPLGSTAIPADAVLAFGTERSGLSQGLLETADMRVSIPMRSGVSSLNLATAVAVVVYGL